MTKKIKKKNQYRSLIIFEFFHKVIMFAILYPLFVFGIRFVMKATGIKYLTNNFFYSFIMSPQAIIFIILLVLLYGIGIMTELNCVDIMLYLAETGKRADIYRICINGVKKTAKVLFPWNIGIVFYCVLECICINAFIVFNTFRKNDLADMAIKTIVNNNMLKLWIAMIFIGIMIVVIFGYFTLNIFINDGGTFVQSYKKSIHLVQNHFFKIAGHIIVFNIGAAAAYIALYIIMSVIVIFGVYVLNLTHMGIAIYLTFVRFFRQIISVIFLFMSVPISYMIINHTFRNAMLEQIPDKKGYDEGTIYVSRNKKILIDFVVIVAIAINVFTLIKTKTMDVFWGIEFFDNTQIVAHRGSSRVYPENTMLAFNQAVDELADCIELDVRQTADGELIVMHDLSLRRTTGVKEDASSLTLSEIKQLDAGSWKSPKFKGEQIPELSEVLEYAHGRIRLNIEIKTGKSDNNFAKKLVGLLEKYDMVDSSVVTAFDYDILKEIKSLNENIKTGYILSVAYGDYFGMKDIDFFSISYAFVSTDMVTRAHEHDKEVYAWTVNSEKSIKRMLECGVDGIITDNPVLAREIIYAENTSATLLEMLQYVFDR